MNEFKRRKAYMSRLLFSFSLYLQIKILNAFLSLSLVSSWSSSKVCVSQYARSSQLMAKWIGIKLKPSTHRCWWVTPNQTHPRQCYNLSRCSHFPIGARFRENEQHDMSCSWLVLNACTLFNSKQKTSWKKKI